MSRGPPASPDATKTRAGASGARHTNRRSLPFWFTSAACASNRDHREVHMVAQGAAVSIGQVGTLGAAAGGDRPFGGMANRLAMWTAAAMVGGLRSAEVRFGQDSLDTSRSGVRQWSCSVVMSTTLSRAAAGGRFGELARQVRRSACVGRAPRTHARALLTSPPKGPATTSRPTSVTPTPSWTAPQPPWTSTGPSR